MRHHARGRRPGRSLVLGFALLAACADSDPLLAPDTPVVLRDHTELSVLASGEVWPLQIGTNPMQLCMAPAARVDTSEWQARLHWRGQRPPPTFSAPSTRLGATLCFAVPSLTAVREGRVAVCGELIDRYDGRSQRLSCQGFIFRAQDPGRDALVAAMSSLFADATARGDVQTVRRLRDLSVRAGAYPLLQTRFRLIASYFARRSGDPVAIAEALADLDEPPAWLSTAPALSWHAQWHYERAAHALEPQANLQQAWIALREAERAYRRIAHPKTFTAVMKRSDLLTRLGKASAAAHRLDAALVDCTTMPCDPHLLPHAHNTLAWATMLQSDPDAAALTRAKAALEQAKSAWGVDEPLERANVLINLGLHAVLTDATPHAWLSEARELIASASEASQRRATALAEWADLVAAVHAMRGGELAQVQALAQPLAGMSVEPRVAAWAFSLLGRTARRQRHLDDAASAFETALILHGQRDASGAMFGASAPGLWADDVYRAARVAVDQGRGGDAWALLADLDEVSANIVCAPAGGNAPASSKRYAELLGELAELQSPASRMRELQRESARRVLLDELQQVSRSNCLGVGVRPRSVAQLRAFALADEIIVLHQDRQGSVEVHHRVPYVRTQLRRDLLALETAMARGVDDRQWRALAAPVARALVPIVESIADEHSADPVRVALHGPLQRVPLGALPHARGWLTDVMTPVLQSVVLPKAAATQVSGTPLFVVNPSGNLRGAADTAPAYRTWFPSASVLYEQEARYREVIARLGQASFVHVDAHATYDPAFPGLSQIRLAGERSLLTDDLIGTKRRYAFVNLSACETGRWPETAGSGAYGIAGAVARGSADWVIAARAALDDAVAALFNEYFYQYLREGAEPVVAYREAHAQVRRAHRASRWAALMLVGGAGGQSALARTP